MEGGRGGTLIRAIPAHVAVGGIAQIRPHRTLGLPSVQQCRTYLASASGVPVRSPLTTCLPRLAARGCPVFCARSPTGVAGASLPLRPWPIGGPHVLSTQWERSLQGLDPVHRYRAVQVSTNTHGERILRTLFAAHRQCEQGLVPPCG